MKLTKKDADILANLYDSVTWQVFRKHFLEQRQMEIAQNSPFLPDMKQLDRAAGRIMALREIESDMAGIKKKVEKRDNQ